MRLLTAEEVSEKFQLKTPSSEGIGETGEDPCHQGGKLMAIP